MRRLKSLSVLVLLAAGLLTGCWENQELEDVSLVLMMGLDRGANGQLLVSAIIGQPQSMGTGVLGHLVIPDKPTLAATLVSAQGSTINQAVYTLNGGTSRQVTLVHTRALVVGETLAREGLEPQLMELLRNQMIRGSLVVFQARGRAVDILQHLQPVDEHNPARMVQGLIAQGEQLHMAPPLRLQHFISRKAALGGDPYLPVAAFNPHTERLEATGHLGSALPGELVRSGGNPVEFIGTAIFREDRLQGFLSVNQTQMMLALRGEMGKTTMTFPDPINEGQSVTLRFHQENLPKYEARLVDGRPHVRIRVLFEGEVLAVPGGSDLAREEVRRQLDKAAATYAESVMRELVAQLNTWDADPIGVGHLYRRWFWTNAEWERFNWSERVKELTVEPEVQMRIRRYGLINGGDRTDGGR